jgi:hypothetical protein
MRWVIFGLSLAMIAAAPSLADASGSHRRSGYFTKNGTYVAPARATNPNRTRVDNWSSKPNVNPYTGKRGMRDPLAPKRRQGGF